jgi:ABC-type transporter Mla subunit MlaD
VQALAAEAAKLTAESPASAGEATAEAKQAAETLAARQKAAMAALAAATDQLKKATDAAQPRDIVDIVVSEPIAIRVLPAEKK